MGQEIDNSEFDSSAFSEFSGRLDSETKLLSSWHDHKQFSTHGDMGGLELEAWLIDQHANPFGINEAFLTSLNDPLVVPELAKFNVELNSTPLDLTGDSLHRMHRELAQTWNRASESAEAFKARLAMIGILPTVTQEELTLENMSPWMRYIALNQQVLRLRGDRPIEIDIAGRDPLKLLHQDVMLESAATSFQIHLKVTQEDAVRCFNLSKILSAPMVAVSANSPYLFGHDLWAETRIPLFEQSVSVGGSDYSKRVTFGIRYAQDSIMECFDANLQRYPVLLPMLTDSPASSLDHLRLHNGTIWRWTRPLIGEDKDGTPHIRIEHRVVPAGPTIIDSIANAAFFYGLIYGFRARGRELEIEIPFEVARKNFYACAREGLDAQVQWKPDVIVPVLDLMKTELLPIAHEGLRYLQIDDESRTQLLGVIEGRLQAKQNGASWQRAWVDQFGQEPHGLLEAYYARQRSAVPVHEWSVSC